MSSDRLSDEPLEFTVDGQDVGKRLDLFLAEHLPRYSRAHLCRVINAAGASVDDRHCKPAYLLRSGQRVLVRLPDLPVEGPVAEDVPLDVLFEDEHLAAINKPAGMVVHPAKGHWQGTLASALAFHFQSLNSEAIQSIHSAQFFLSKEVDPKLRAQNPKHFRHSRIPQSS